MTSLRKIPLYLVAALLLGTLPAWGQALFEDDIEGTAFACKETSYNESGNIQTGYKIQDQTADNKCENGSSMAKSNAQIAPPLVGAGATSNPNGKENVFASGTATSMDTAILTPPDGFTGNQVKVVVKSKYKFKVVSIAQNGSYAITWVVKGGANCGQAHEVSSDEDGEGTQTLAFDCKVPKVNSGFQLPLEIDAATSAAYGSSASCSVVKVNLEFHQAGWNYKWASQSTDNGELSDAGQ
jgi:hypothetical protein